MTRRWIAAAPRWAANTGRRGRRLRTTGSAPQLFWYLMAAWSYELRFLIILLRGLLLVFLGSLLLAHSRQVRRHRIRESRLLSGSQWRDEARRDYHQQLVGRFLRGMAAEQVAQNRHIAQAFHLVQDLRYTVVDEHGDGETLAILQHHFRFGRPRGNRG